MSDQKPGELTTQTFDPQTTPEPQAQAPVFQPPQPKKSKKTLIAVISGVVALILLLVGIGGYLVFDTFQKNQAADETISSLNKKFDDYRQLSASTLETLEGLENNYYPAEIDNPDEAQGYLELLDEDLAAIQNAQDKHTETLNQLKAKNLKEVPEFTKSVGTKTEASQETMETLHSGYSAARCMAQVMVDYTEVADKFILAYSKFLSGKYATSQEAIDTVDDLISTSEGLTLMMDDRAGCIKDKESFFNEDYTDILEARKEAVLTLHDGFVLLGDAMAQKDEDIAEDAGRLLVKAETELSNLDQVDQAAFEDMRSVIFENYRNFAKESEQSLKSEKETLVKKADSDRGLFKM